MGNKILTTIIDKFKEGPVGNITLQTAVSEKFCLKHRRRFEPFLIPQGLLIGTLRGREGNGMAYGIWGNKGAIKGSFLIRSQ